MTDPEDLYATAGTANKWTGYAEAFTIFAKYAHTEGADPVTAGHDEIYAGPSPDVVSPADRCRLSELGWRADARYNCWNKFT